MAGSTSADRLPDGPTADGRHLVIDGRRWRATDPSIPDAFRAELQRELMAARRAMGAAKRGGRDVGPARARVHDAKVALGERGEPWWEPPTTEGRRIRIEAAIRTLLRARRPESSICPSDVARTIGGTGWRSLMVEVRDVAAELAEQGTIRVTQGDRAVDPLDTPGPLRLRRADGFPDPDRSMG